MTRDLNIDIPDSLFSKLQERANAQGVSIEALCLSLLAEVATKEGSLYDPVLYRSLNLEILRREVNNVVGSTLPADEVRKRVNALDFEISRRYIR